MRVHFAPLRYIVALFSLLRGCGRWARKWFRVWIALCGRTPVLSRSPEIAVWAALSALQRPDRPQPRRQPRRPSAKPRCSSCGRPFPRRGSVDDPHMNLRITM